MSHPDKLIEKYKIASQVFNNLYCKIYKTIRITDNTPYFCLEYDSSKAPLQIQQEMSLWVSSQRVFPDLIEKWDDNKLMFVVFSDFQGIHLEKLVSTFQGLVNQETIPQIFLKLYELFLGLYESQVQITDIDEFTHKIFYSREGLVRVFPVNLYEFFEGGKGGPGPIRRNTVSAPESTYIPHLGKIFEGILVQASSDSSITSDFSTRTFLDEILEFSRKIASGEFASFKALEAAWELFVKGRKAIPQSFIKAEIQVEDPADVHKKEIVRSIETQRLAPQSTPKKSLSTQLMKSIEELRYRLPWSKRVGLGRTALMLHQLAVMLESGVSVVRAFDILGNQEENPHLQSAYRAIAEKLSQGGHLSDACEAFPNVFPESVILLIRAGEESGSLAKRLEGGAQLFERYSKISTSLRQAITSPLITCSVFLVFIALTVKFLLPHFVSFFTQLGIPLPFISELVVWIIIIANSPIVLFAVLAALVALYLYRKKLPVTLFNYGLRITYIRKLLGKILGAQFCNIVAFLYRDGVGLPATMELLVKTAFFPVHAEYLNQVYDRVINGVTLSDAIRSVPYFPNAISKMLVVGEGTGKIDLLLLATSRYMENEVLYTLEQVSALIEPMATLLLGIVMAFFFIGLLLPLYQIINKLGG